MDNPGPIGLTGIGGVNGSTGEAGLPGLGADLKSCRYYEDSNSKEIKQNQTFPPKLIVAYTIQEVRTSLEIVFLFKINTLI